MLEKWSKLGIFKYKEGLKCGQIEGVHAITKSPPDAHTSREMEQRTFSLRSVSDVKSQSGCGEHEGISVWNTNGGMIL